MKSRQTLYTAFVMLRLFLFVTALGWAATACSPMAEQPEINKGYKTNIRVPDGEELTDEDRDFVEAQEIEYEDATQ